MTDDETMISTIDPLTEHLTEHRAADQDTAMAKAFVAGTLPEEDRRQPVPLHLMEEGSSLTRVRGGWQGQVIRHGVVFHEFFHV